MKYARALIALSLLLKQFTNVAEANPQYGRYDRVIKQKKAQCESTTCSKLIPDEAYNCVHSCMSTACYNEVYASSPLEDGEVDTHRYFLFNKCMHNELKEEYMASVREKRAKTQPDGQNGVKAET
jgi:Domain of unknown function (DUF4787)